jgi:hypothetical protein
VVACGTHLSCLHVSCCDGKVSLVAACELQQQASALGLLQLSGEWVVAQQRLQSGGSLSYERND